MKNLVYPLLAPVCAMLLWILIAEFSIVPAALLPSPMKVFQYLFSNFSSDLAQPTFRTAQLWLTGSLFGVIGGVVLGLLMGYYGILYRMSEVLIEFSRSLPTLVVLPIVTIFMGIGNAPKMFIVVFTAALYMMINTAAGVRYGKHSRATLGRVLRMTPFQKFTMIILPSSWPSIFTGLRISITLSLIGAVGADMVIGGKPGLGRQILDDMMVYNLREMYCIVFITGLMGYCSNKIFSILENKLIHWRGQ